MRPPIPHVGLALNLSSVLSQTKSSFLGAHLLPSGKPYASLVVGATIFHPTTNKLLLLKRAPTEKLFPLSWEIPGGKVEHTDRNIYRALKREVKEETGLSVRKADISNGVIGFDWSLGESIHGEPKMALEMNFVIEGEEVVDAVKVDPEEHSESLWASEMETTGLEMTSEMRRVVRRAFAFVSRRKDA